jgi:hypothetical protein
MGVLAAERSVLDFDHPVVGRSIVAGGPLPADAQFPAVTGILGGMAAGSILWLALIAVARMLA